MITDEFRIRMRYYCRDLSYACNWHLQGLRKGLLKESGNCSISLLESCLSEIGEFRSFVDDPNNDRSVVDFREASFVLRENLFRGRSCHFFACYSFDFCPDSPGIIRLPVHYMFFALSDRKLILRACRAEALARSGFAASFGDCIDNYCGFLDCDPTCFEIYADWVEENGFWDSGYRNHLKKLGRRFGLGRLNFRG